MNIRPGGTDGSHTFHRLRTTLTPAQEAVVVELRKTLLLPLDDLLVVTREFIHPDVSRSGLDHCLRRHGVSNLTTLLPQEEDPQTPQHKTFKDSPPGFVHVDVKYLPQLPDEDQRCYLFAAVDRTTRWVYIELLQDKSATAASGFLTRLIDQAPFIITKVLTDNDKAFTDRFCATGERQPTDAHAFDRVCTDHHIEHRLTKPRPPQTNGMSERFNGRIADVLRTTHFDSATSLQTTLKRFVHLYNHHIPQKNLHHKTPLQTLQQWYAHQPQLFKKIPRNYPGPDTPSVPSAQRSRVDVYRQYAPSATGRGLIAAVVGYLGLMSMTVFLIDETRVSTLLDEYFVVAMLPLAVIGSTRFYRVLPRSMGLILIYFYWVFVSSIIVMLGKYEGQIPLSAPVIGVILDLKIFVVLFALVALSHRLRVNSDEAILRLCKAIVIITFIHAPFVARDIVSSGYSLAGIALQENPLWGYIPRGLFSHKLGVALLSSLAIAAALTLYIHRQQAIIYLLYSIVFFVMLSFSSSLKELVATATMVPVLVIFQLRTGRGKSGVVGKKGVQLVYLLGAVGLATFLLWEYVGGLLEARSTYLTEETVRGRMYTASIEIAFDMFPFGSGAGTFGSYPSVNIYYSPLYNDYGLSTLYGASGEGPDFLMDTWWPKVFGEGGIIGGGAYLAIMGTAFLGLARNFLRASSPANTFGLFSGILVLFASIASSPFNSNLGMLIGALFMLMFYLERRSRSI